MKAMYFGAYILFKIEDYSLNVESNMNPNILNSNGEMLSLHRIERLDFF